jgi:hypothetical protein
VAVNSLNSTKSLAKALKGGRGSVKKVQLLEKANVDLQNDLAAACLKMKDAVRQIIDNKTQLDNQLDAKHQTMVKLGKDRQKKRWLPLASRKRSPSVTMFIHIALPKLWLARYLQKE